MGNRASSAPDHSKEEAPRKALAPHPPSRDRAAAQIVRDHRNTGGDGADDVPPRCFGPLRACCVLRMPIDLETLEATLAALDDFARRNLPDAKLRELDEKDEFPEDLVRRMCSDELGIQLFFVPEEYGGLGAGSYGVYRICEHLAGVDVGIATGVLATFLGLSLIHIS